ncbi:MAG: hypothetical protein SAJ12_03605 [Jaaginema sp. PMC 1079.18]|nr:hypothetical protein [Jaaginema sp. PMC 1080.18]MEC4850075.1 hypothetical protein [Jaaginema sp. PMC 1079.18]MEC4868779.1 hypothetical protein [Jaaginema sp. PMC 1078.18]
MAETNNGKACESLKKDGEYLKKTIDFEFVECHVADCSKSEEVKVVFDRILDYLADNITDLDQEYISSCQKSLANIQGNVNQQINLCREVFSYDSEDDYQEIEELFSELFGDDDSGWWREVVLSLQSLRKELWDNRQVPDLDLRNAVDKAIEACENDKGILSSSDPISEINQQIQLKSPFRAYPDYQDELRVLISHHFLTLDKGLHQSLAEVKAKVIDILKDKGKLGKLVDSQDNDFLDAIAQKIPEKKDKLKDGFQIIADFNISYRSMILPRIRKYLDGLTNISATAGQTTYDESSDKTLEVSKDTTAEEILVALEIDYEKAVNRIKPALEELLEEPSQAAYAMVEEFVDNVIRQKGIKKEWKSFLRLNRSQIWPDEFGKAEKEKEMRQKWIAQVNQVAERNKTELLQLT